MKELIERIIGVQEAVNTPLDRAISKIEKMTDWNDHAGAIKAGYKLLGDKKGEKILDLISKLHMEIGHMPDELMTLRSYYYKDMMEKAKKKFSPEDYEKFHGSF